MDTMLILGDGALGRAVEAATLARDAADTQRPARTVRLIGRPVGERHDRRDLAGASMIVEASRGDAVVTNLTAALEAGCRAFVIATTGWSADRSRVEALARASHGAVAVAASNFSLGVVLFGRLVEAAVDLFGPLDAFDPYLVEWHRRSKRDRPSGTAADLARRIVARHPRLASRRRPRGRLAPGGRIARDAPRRVRCDRRDGRASLDRARPLAVCGRDPRRRRLARADPACARPPRLRPRRRRAHRSPPDRCLKGTPMTPTFRQTQTETLHSRDPPDAPRRVHRPRHAVHRRRRPRRGRLPPPRPLADPGRHRRPRPMRHDRRVPHPVDRGTRAPDRRDRRGRRGTTVARPDPGGRRDRHQRHRRHDPGDPPGRRARRRRRARRGALLQPARQPDARGPFPGDRRRGRPADRRLQRPVADRRERRCRHVPAAGRAPARRRGQGGERQPRADRPDLSRPAARRRGPGRRRRLDAADPGARRRRRRLGGIERDPGRARARCARPRWPATGTRRGGSTSAGCRSSSATSAAARTRSR